jgi:serine O-acetyltransferase
MTDVQRVEEMSFWQLVRSDIEATTHANFRLYSNTRFWLRAIAKLLVSSNVRVVLVYRIGHVLAKRKWGLPLALLLREYGIRSSGAEINPLAVIGPGLYLAHSVGVGVGAYVRIGANCRLHLGTVLGPQRDETSAPQPVVVGDDVVLGTHAVIMGGVTIGDGAVIGANAVVVRDVEPNAVVSAAPARNVGVRQ